MSLVGTIFGLVWGMLCFGLAGIAFLLALGLLYGMVLLYWKCYSYLVKKFVSASRPVSEARLGHDTVCLLSPCNQNENPWLKELMTGGLWANHFFGGNPSADGANIRKTEVLYHEM